jgi:cation:H+ antiporter
MEVIIYLLLIFVGFGLLIKGADFLIDGASSLAYKLNVTPMVIGLTIVAFGTSTPELLVNIFAAFEGNTGVSFGNIVGSNIANIFLILGISSIVRPLSTKNNTVWKEIPFTLLAGLVLFVLANDILFGGSDNLLSSGDGIILLFFFIIFFIYVFSIAKVDTNGHVEIKTLSNLKIAIYIIAGLLGLMGGAKLVVDNAILIAHLFQIGERVIGLTLVALGTSLPELFTSVVAAKKGEVDIAVGNVVGSNIFNIFFILAATAIIEPLRIISVMNIDLSVMILASLFLFFSMFTGGKRVIDRWEGILFLILYLVYTFWLYFAS